MKKIKHSLLFFLFALLTSTLSAQPIVEGEKALNNGEYEKAQEYFNEVIRGASQVQPFELSLAYYYRAWTWIKLYGPGPSDITAMVSDPSGEMLINAFNDLIDALTYEDGRLTKRINDLLVQIEPSLIQFGLVMVNRAEDFKDAGKPYKSTAALAQKYLEPASRINHSYLAYDLLGQSYMLSGDVNKAVEMFKNATTRYQVKLPDYPDFLIGYAYFRMASIYRDDLNDENQALDALHAGKKLLDEEFQRISQPGQQGGDPKLAAARKEYLKVTNDLHTLELETYLKSPSKLSEAQAVFKSEMVQHPGDVNLIIAYASLFEKSDPDVAITYYKKALAVEPGNSVAEYNLAAVYYNQGQKYFNLGVRDQDDKAKSELNISTGQDYFKLARPIFEKYLQSNPNDRETLSALKGIAFSLDDTRAFEKYKQMLGE